MDDEAPARNLLAQALRLNGFDVTEACTGDQAEMLIREGKRPNVLITDQIMPGRVQGNDLIASVQHHSPDTGSILLSGYLDVDTDGQVGQTVTIRKPTPLSNILRTVRSLLPGCA